MNIVCIELDFASDQVNHIYFVGLCTVMNSYSLVQYLIV